MPNQRTLFAVAHPKQQALDFEDDPYALAYRRPSPFWEKVAAGTNLAAVGAAGFSMGGGRLHFQPHRPLAEVASQPDCVTEADRRFVEDLLAGKEEVRRSRAEALDARFRSGRQRYLDTLPPAARRRLRRRGLAPS